MSEIDDAALREKLKIAQAYARLKNESKIHDWNPLPKQWEYINCHSKIKTFTACNQGGKTSTACFEEASHATGIYHKDWRGVRYKKPVDIWIVGETSDRVRDTLQEKLFGPIGQFGTGIIPKECVDFDSMIMRPGTPGAIQRARIKHTPTGGWSSIQFFSFDQGREKFQGSTIDRVLFDEEPPDEIVGECKMRLIVKDGTMCFTFTPLTGITQVYKWLMDSENVARFNITMDELPWMTEEKIERMLDGLAEHEKMARRYGIAMVGSGLVYRFKVEDYTCDSFELPKHWPRIHGFDLGINHPTSAVSAAWDREADCVYIYQEYCVKDKTPPEHAMVLRNWGEGVPFAMSHDAFNRSSQTGISTASVYEKEGIKVINAGKDRWAKVETVRARIGSNRLYIFKDRCPQLLREMRTYRTKEDGRTIIRVDDDTIAAFEHAVAHIDKAVVPGAKKPVLQFTVKEHVPFDKRIGI